MKKIFLFLKNKILFFILTGLGVEYQKEEISVTWQDVFVDLKRVFVWLAILTAVVYFTTLVKFLPGRPYPAAKVLMSGAITIHVLYVKPLNHLGYKNPLTWPFYFVQNALYKAGLHFIPKDDGEREMWWSAIRFTDYEDFIVPAVTKQKMDNKNKKSRLKRLPLYEKWTNEVYSHIEPLATLKIKDKEIRKYRYGVLVDVIYEYYAGRDFYRMEKVYLETGLPGIHSMTSYEVSRYRNILDIFLKSKEYTEKFEPEGWDHFYNKTQRFLYDDKFVYKLTQYIYIYEVNNNTFSCSSPNIDLHMKARNRLYENRDNKKLPAKERWNMSWLYGFYDAEFYEMIVLCPENAMLQDYAKKHFQSRGSQDSLMEAQERIKKRKNKGE